MIHLYCGDGKGKTTAACGLAVRAAGSGMRVLFTQFLKDGTSSEIAVLSSVKGITVLKPEEYFGWARDMTAAQRARLKECYTALISDIAVKSDSFDMIVLDEAVAAYRYGLFDKAVFTELLSRGREDIELVLTGRDPDPELIQLADYITEMRKEKHPFDLGVGARKGIEY